MIFLNKYKRNYSINLYIDINGINTDNSKVTWELLQNQELLVKATQYWQ